MSLLINFLCFCTGGLIGVVMMAVLAASRDDDDKE